MADSKHAVLCDTCLQGKKRLSALTLCKECRELYCMECSSRHAVIPVTKEHLLIKISNAKTDSKVKAKLLPPICSACELMEKGRRQAGYFCDECRDIYCGTCKEYHITLKATKHHTMYGIPIDGDNAADTTWQPDLGKSLKLASDFEGFNFSPEDDRFARTQAKASTKKRRSHLLDVKVLEREDIDKVFAEFVTTFIAKSKTDKEQCYFGGIISLSQERIVLLDNKNEKLKLFGKDDEILSEVKLPPYSCGLTRFRDDTVAVLFGSQVLFYSIQHLSLVKESKSFRLEPVACGISFNGSVFAVSYNGMISVLSNDGQVLHQIKTKYSWSLYVCIDHETSNIFLSDRENNEVNCISTKGEIKWQTETDKYRGLITFHNCLLVAAGTKILLLTCDGKYQKTIFEDEDILTEADYISFDDKTHRLFITQVGSDMVTVLQLHY